MRVWSLGSGPVCDGVDQAQVNEIQFDLGIEAIAQRSQNVVSGIQMPLCGQEASFSL